MVSITKSYLTKNPCYTKAVKRKSTTGLMLHSVGCAQPKASVFISSFNSASIQKCVHGFIDGNTGDFYQTLPWDYRAWHCGSGSKGSANSTHIGIEMCEPAYIKYTTGNSFTITNKTKAVASAKTTYEAAVKLFAYLCKEFSLDPTKDGVIISHNEGNERGIASDHGDPEHLWKGLGLSYTMDGFRKDVKATMDEEEAAEKAAKEAEAAAAAAKKTTLYKVQVGAYSKKANAQDQLKKVKAAGFDATIVIVGKLYKVQVGAYSKKANAQDQLKKVKAAGFDATIVTA
jgi:N-acetylmuramoyl-L-alanine amidase CwlA